MKIAIFQGPSLGGSRANTLSSIRKSVAASAALDANYIVFPELYLNGYNASKFEWATLDDTQNRIGAVAKEFSCGIVIGFAEQDGDDRYNSALAVGQNGHLQCHYRKIQLFGAREQALFSAGRTIPTFTFNEAKIALLICYDVEFPGHVEALAKQSVDVILTPTANMQPYSHVPRTVIPALAASYGVNIVYANYCGQENEITYAGESTIADRNGAIISVAGQHPALLICDIPMTHRHDISAVQSSKFQPAKVH